ncbi:MAG: phosphate ABC transporter permease subunit PstC, partial [Halobacteriales archaeon]|nr:phosphate ABC transporter permease subunit PstC [Halobacteriales archaeon]
MGTDSYTLDLERRTESSPREILARWFVFACAGLSVVTTVMIAFLLVSESMRFFSETAPLIGYEGETVPILAFLTGTTWQTTAGQFGVLAPVTGTLQIVIGSGLIALPLGVATAIYLSEYASEEVRAVLKPALEILAGIPTVVYGFFALVYITPALQTVLPVKFFNMLSPSIVVGIMIIPMVSSLSEDAMTAVPDELREAGYGLGATKFDVSVGIVVPAAISGIFASLILALSRAIGETMAVVVAAGGRAQFLNPFNPAAYAEPNMPMTAAIV